jgi:hypothetical protein
MNDSSLSIPACEVLAIARSSAVFRPLIEDNPDLFAVLVQAADSAKTIADYARLIGALTRAVLAGDKCVDLICRSKSGALVDLTEASPIAHRAGVELGEILRELVPAAGTIGIVRASGPHRASDTLTFSKHLFGLADPGPATFPKFQTETRGQKLAGTGPHPRRDSNARNSSNGRGASTGATRIR